MIETSQRLLDYPFALEFELRDAANGQGYRIAQGQADGWLFYSSASVPGEIAVAATASGIHGPFFCQSLIQEQPENSKQSLPDHARRGMRRPLPS
ncbi:hypothetical protein [Novosphingobium sp. AAP83]|uniref:hypothetical protein n=1 Tax=Novosphingobium sp. AAP83 TaxID=1523425 RepID=UPI000A7E72A3|nr:hypothetical protein [Novosphingobium sp. AAP83]